MPRIQDASATMAEDAKQARLTHAQIVRLALEQEIMSGQLPPGTPLDEEEVAERFAVSRTPVREAMQHLAQSGLVEKQPRQPAVVARIDVKRLIQLFELTSELEGVCGRLAARRMSKAERAELGECHALSAAFFEQGDGDEYYKHSRRFHALIVRGTHNDAMIEATDKAGLPLIPFRRFQLRYPGRSQANLQEHGEILRALLAGSPEETGELLRRHATIQGDVLAEYVSIGAG